MTTKAHIHTHKKTAIIVGALILAAYAVMISAIFESLIIGMLIEVFSGVAVIAIPFLMFPLLKPYNRQVTLGYLVCRIIEGAALIITGLLLLSSSPALLGIRDWIGVYHAYIFIPAALMFYYVLYQSKLIPRFISVWGVLALIALFIVNVLEITGRSSAIANVLYLPIITNEVFLAFWLFVKGFNASAIVSRTA